MTGNVVSLGMLRNTSSPSISGKLRSRISASNGPFWKSVQPFSAIPDHRHGIAEILQVLADPVGKPGVIIDQQIALCHCCRFLSPSFGREFAKLKRLYLPHYAPLRTVLPDARTTCALYDAQVSKTLDTLHQDARNDWLPMLKHAPQAFWGLLRGKSMMEALTPEMLKDAFIPVSAEQGRYLYSLAVAANAQHVVEFGSSFGIGTIYLAAAAKDTGGHVITTEIKPSKCDATCKNRARL
ncbi:O-methyltransferase [Ruegeria sp. Ofav3-42]|uniref:O-methyltransferase n=1 Tax=Ruegeria sp. Ofav3-42 TaxID=2917759 RepID=UPI001EF68F91|nr:hypothetical protein [Ruegeria sp. Ofav3-42]MCG7522570.1 hypothetical protein [Ruegeria sp. Ofav3-42]